HRRLDRRRGRSGRYVSGRVEDDDVGWADPRPELLQGLLVRLVRGVAGDREALVPALAHLARGEPAEEREDDPRADHLPAMARDDASEAGEHPRENLHAPVDVELGLRHALAD